MIWGISYIIGAIFIFLATYFYKGVLMAKDGYVSDEVHVFGAMGSIFWPLAVPVSIIAGLGYLFYKGCDLIGQKINITGYKFGLYLDNNKVKKTQNDKFPYRGNV